MNKYTILKWEKLLVWLIPPILRKKTHIDWLNVLLAPLHTIYEDILYKMQHTGQVIYLEKLLNDTFNPTKNYNPNLTTEQKKQNKLIYIDEPVKPSLQYVYLHKEYYNLITMPNGTVKDGPIKIPQLKIYNHSEYKNSDNKPVYLTTVTDYAKTSYANFKVFIPKSLIDNYTIVAEPNTENSTQKTEAVRIASIEYHNLLNFYKLAGKSYENYTY